ncbi:MAG: hypothetical protein J6C26_10080 [Clostridia bacterium]|nr:hypothetical protein [Clostridia bacterium]
MLRKNWLKKYEGTVSARDYRLLDKASRILMQNVVPQEENSLWNPYRGICPSYTKKQTKNGLATCFPGIWNWDSAFHMVGVSRFDAELAQEQMEAFFLFQKEDGMLPDVIFTPERDNRIMDQYGKPPVWAWAMERMDRNCPDDRFLKKMYPKLVLNENFWRTQRFREEDGLFFYSTSEQGKMRLTYIGWESGLDDSIRFDDGAIEYMYPLDLNCFMISFYKSMQYLALRQNLTEDAEKWAAREKELTARVQQVMWCEEDQCFWDWNFKEKDFARVLTPAAFMPLWVGIATPAQAAALEALAADKEKLYPCMPTVSKDHPKMNPTGYWRGSVWMNVAYFAIKGLYDYGFRSTSMGIRDTLLRWMDEDETIHENYNPLTGEGKCAPNFSWSCVFAMEMILEMK